MFGPYSLTTPGRRWCMPRTNSMAPTYAHAIVPTDELIAIRAGGCGRERGVKWT